MIPASPDRASAALGIGPWRAAIATLVATRIPVLLCGIAAVLLIGTWPPPTAEAVWRVSPRELANLLARWDTAWYYSVAVDGYHWDPSMFRHENVVFFPLYPLLIRAGVSLVGNHPLAVGLAISLAAFAGAIALIYKLASEELGPEYAGPVVVLMSCYPFALYYSAVYTESLFLFLTVASFYAMRHRQTAVVALTGLLAGLCRPNGLWLSAPLLIMALSLRDEDDRARTWSPSLVVAAVSPIAGVAMYSAYLWSRFGDPLAWVHGQAAWGLPLALRAGADDGPPIARALSETVTDVVMWAINIGVFAAAVRAIPAVRRRFGAPYAVWIGVNLFPPFFTHLVMSMGRFTAVLFPLFFLMATTLPASRLWRVASCFAAAQALLATLFFLWRPIV